jgi:hypothetical protein
MPARRSKISGHEGGRTEATGKKERRKSKRQLAAKKKKKQKPSRCRKRAPISMAESEFINSSVTPFPMFAFGFIYLFATFSFAKSRGRGTSQISWAANFSGSAKLVPNHVFH